MSGSISWYVRIKLDWGEDSNDGVWLKTEEGGPCSCLCCGYSRITAWYRGNLVFSMCEASCFNLWLLCPDVIHRSVRPIQDVY